MKVGDYVRTKYGITQFKEYETTNGEKLLCMPVKDGSQGIFANIEDVVKSSPNIIDILEVGDYVNGVEVKDIDDEWITMSDTKIPILKSIANGLIKSIVTKEQFEQMAYKVSE